MKALSAFLVAALLLAQSAYAATVTTIQFSLTVSNATYTSNLCLGAAGGDARLALTSAASGAGGSGTLQSITVVDPGGTNGKIDFILFSQQPGSHYTDDATCTLNSADYIYAEFPVVHVMDWPTAGAVGVGAVPYEQGIVYKLSSGTSLYAVPVSRGGVYTGQTLVVTFVYAAD